MGHATARIAGRGNGTAALAFGLALTAALLAAGLFAPSAGAQVEHAFKETFGSAEQPVFGHAEGMAVDQGSHDLLVIDIEDRTVNRFKPNGEPDPFPALGTNAIDGKRAGGTNECPTVPEDCDETPGNAGILSSFEGYAGEVQVAVDNSGAATDGNIYVTDAGIGAIDAFAADGSYLGQLSEYKQGPGAEGALKAFGEACGVAVDEDGAVYVGDYTNNLVHKYEQPVSPHNPLQDEDNTANFAVTHPCSVAAGAGPGAGDIFATTYQGEVQKLDGSSGAVAYTVSAGANTTVGVDPASGHLYVAKGTQALEFDASGPEPTLLSATEAGAEVEGLAVDGDTGDLYLALEGDPHVEVYAPLVPSVEAWAEGVGFTEATLRAQINPVGIETGYRFEHGTDASYGNATADIALGSDTTEHDVSLPLEGLAPGATYHWRVVAITPGGEEPGSDMTFTTYAPLAHGPCPNDALRAPPSDALPDCRAYEMVSPVDKNGGDIVARSAYRQASLAGNRVTYTSTAVFAGALRSTKANQYLAARGAGGWSTDALYPSQGTTVFDPNFDLQYDFNTNFQAFTPDLCHAIMRDHNETPLTEEAIAGYTNLYLRDNCGPGAGSYEALTVGRPPTFSQEGVNLNVDGRNYSADLSHVVFIALAALKSTPEASGAENINAPQIYDSVRTPAGREMRLISVLPDGSSDPNASSVAVLNVTSAHGSNLSRALSKDGSRVFWSSDAGPGGTKTIYLRLNPTGDTDEECATPADACTITVSETGTDIDRFWTANTEGSKAVLSEGGTEGEDLYEFDVASALAEEPAHTKIASELGGVVGASEDLSHLYFTSTEAIPGSGANKFGGEARADEANIYLRREGQVVFVATLAAADDNPSYALDNNGAGSRGARVTPDGRGLAFMSLSPELAASVAGADNANRDTGEPIAEVYLFDADSEELRCASCNPAGARAAGQAPPGAPGLTAAAWLPTCEWSNYCKRALSADGNRVFFNSFDALVPEDTNDAQDVYEWEAPGSGTCTTSNPRYFPRNGGCVHLISTGRSKEDSEFTDASASGSDAFFTTASDIDPRDEAFIDLYDARVGGGFPPPSPEADPCVGDACQSVPPAPEAPAPTSEGYAGPGNEARSPGGCAGPARRAKALARKAKRARRAAKRSSQPKRSRALRRRARKVARKAKRSSNAAKRCRRRGRAGS